MGDWLKDRPFVAWLLNLVSAVLIVFIGFWAYGFRDSSAADEERMARLEREKATFKYVDDQITEVTEYDKKQDEKVETMRKEWRVDQKEILELIRAIK